MSENDRKPAGDNEGEGSRSADQHYHAGVEETVRRGHVEEDAERAAKELEAHPDELRQAEEQGRARSAGEARGDLRK